MGSFPSSQEPTCVLWPFRDWARARRAVEVGGHRLTYPEAGQGEKGHMGALTEVPSPESLDEEELISKSAGPVAGL